MQNTKIRISVSGQINCTTRYESGSFSLHSSKYNAVTDFTLDKEGKILDDDEVPITSTDNDKINELLKSGTLGAGDIKGTVASQQSVSSALWGIKCMLIDVISGKYELAPGSYIEIRNNSNDSPYKLELTTSDDCVTLLKKIKETVPTEYASDLSMMVHEAQPYLDSVKEYFMPYSLYIKQKLKAANIDSDKLVEVGYEVLNEIADKVKMKP